MTLKWQIKFVILAQAIIITCLNMSDPFWPLIVHKCNLSLSQAQVQYWSALIYIVPFLLTMITIPLWGSLGDKIGHKKMLIRAILALVVTQALISCTSNPLLILMIRLCQGVFAGYSAAAQAWSIAQSNSSIHSHVIGRMQAGTAIGSILGPVFGGLIANYLGYPALFLTSALVCSLVLMALTKFLNETPKNLLTQKKWQFKNMFVVNKSIFCLLMLISATQAARWMGSSFFALYAIQRLGGTNLTVGILYSISALAVFVSAPRWGAIVDRKLLESFWVKGLLMMTLLLAGLAQFVFALSSSFYLACFASLLWGICLGAISLIPFSFLVKEAKDSKGGILGFGNSASKFGNLLGVAAGAFIQAHSNFTWSFIAIGIVYTLIGMLSLLLRFRFQVFDNRSVSFTNA